MSVPVKNIQSGTPSRFISRHDNREGGEKTEITAQITVPPDGGWGWIVVFASFFSIFILDGVTYTFGALLNEISQDLNVSTSLVALINSTSVALYFIGSPLASALINRYGFRECAMCGSVICSFALLSSYFTTTYITLFIFYGVIAGFGYALINMSASLVVGFYFERLRSVAMAIGTCGSSVGIMALFPINTYLIKIGGWRATTLLHSAFFAISFFLGLTYRPLLSFQVAKATEDVAQVRTVTYLPSVASASADRSGVHTLSEHAKTDELVPTATERLFNAVKNVNFPTVAEVVEADTDAEAETPGPSTAGSSKILLTTLNLDVASSTKQIKQVQSISRNSERIEIQSDKKGPKRGFFHWVPHVPQSRPLYRDDAFYQGNIEDLPVYQKSKMSAKEESKTSFKYRLAVSRTLTIQDIEDRRRVMTTAMRRVLATMMDPSLLSKWSFILLCISGFLTYVGFMVPYVYLSDRNLQNAVDPTHCALFVSAISASNAIGRLGLGMLAAKLDPLKLFAFGCSAAGISTIASDISYHIYYQYTYCIIFGFSIASVAVLRSLILVSLYGLDKLTNATGMMLIFLGIGNLISTPIAGVIKENYGYGIAFYVAGIFITLSGLILLPVKTISMMEEKRENEIQAQKQENRKEKEKEKGQRIKK